MDNLSSREGSRIGVLLGAAGASLLLLAPRGPGPDSVWNAFARLEARRRKAAAQAFDALSAAVGKIAGARHGGRPCRPPPAQGFPIFAGTFSWMVEKVRPQGLAAAESHVGMMVPGGEEPVNSAVPGRIHRLSDTSKNS